MQALERRTRSARIPEARALAPHLRALALGRRAAPLLYLEVTGLDALDEAQRHAARAAIMRAAAAALRVSSGSIIRRNDPVVAGPGARWFAALLVDRAVAAPLRGAVPDAEIGAVAGRLRVAVQCALDEARVAQAIGSRVGVRAGWTVIEPRDGDRPLGEFRHALRGAAVMSRVEERRAILMAAITHELRTPLTSIVGFVEQLSDGAWEDRAKRVRALAVVADEARRLTRLVDGLIDMGAWNAGCLVLRRQSVRLRSVVNRAVESVADRARSRGVTILVSGDTRAKIDPDRLLQVLVNLLDNAVRHARRQVKIDVATVKRVRTQTVSVSDDGPGFERETARALGTPFAAGSGGHVGLGLSISKMLVEAHGGTIEARGSRVTITLPT